MPRVGYVDAARRLVHDDDLGLALHGLAQHQLLLVAAGELAGTHRGIAGPDVEAARRPLQRPGLAGGVEEDAAQMALQRQQREVGPQPHIGQQPFALAVLGHVGEPRRQRLRDVREARDLAAHLDLARRAVVQADDRFGDRRSARADEAGEAEDLTLAQIERHVPDARRLEMPHRQHDRRIDIRLMLGRVEVGQLAADHHLRRRIRRQRDRGNRGDELTVAQHRHPVGQPHDLVELVRDEDDGDTARREPADLLEQRLRLAHRQHGGRLVHDQHPGVAADRLGDLDHLLVGHRQGIDARIGVDVDMQRFEQGARLVVHFAGAEEAATVDLAAQEDRIHHPQMLGEVELLVDEDDAHALGLPVGRQRHGLAVINDGARGRLLEARQDLHQRRLAGAVLADDGVDPRPAARRNRC